MLMGEVMAQEQFGTWVAQFASTTDIIVLKLLSGETVQLCGPFHFGEGFIVGSASRGTPNLVAVRYDAVATVRGEKFEAGDRPLNYPPGSAI
jgi:hypothetical protein